MNLFSTMSLPAGLELHQNVLSPEEQLKMVQTIEEWVVQVSLLAQTFDPVKAMLLHGHTDSLFLPVCCKLFLSDSNFLVPAACTACFLYHAYCITTIHYTHESYLQEVIQRKQLAAAPQC